MYKQLFSLGILFSALHFGHAQGQAPVASVDIRPVVDAINQMKGVLLGQLSAIDTKLSNVQTQLSALNAIKEASSKMQDSLSAIQNSVGRKDTLDTQAAADAAKEYYDKLTWINIPSLKAEIEKINGKLTKDNFVSELRKIQEELAIQKGLIEGVAINPNSKLPVDSRINIIKSAYEAISNKADFMESKIKATLTSQKDIKLSK